MMTHRLLLALLPAVLGLAGCRAQVGHDGPAPRPHINWPRTADDYPWPQSRAEYEPIAQRLPTPASFTRADVTDRSWAQWLRHLPLMPQGTPVLSREGSVIVPANSPHLGGVVDMDVRKNQECADVILRLRAEYLRWAERKEGIVFPLGDGGRMSWPEWKNGMRPRLEGQKLRFHQTANPDGSRKSFERFLDSVFAWCGTYSLLAAGERVTSESIQVGDFFVHGGSPGHAVLIADLAQKEAGRLKGLLLQGYMPPQSAHVLSPGGGSPWFDLDPKQPVDTPFWGAFEWSELRRFQGDAR